MFSKFFQNNFQINELFKLKNEIEKKIKLENLNKKTNLKIIDLTESNPTLCDFDYSVFNLNTLFSNKNNYIYRPSPNGTEELRESVKNYYEQRFQNSIPKIRFFTDNLFFTSGTSESYSHIFRLFCNTGDNILIPSPGYPLIYYLAQINSFKIKYYNIKYRNKHWAIDFNSLKSKLNKKTKCIVAINPNNPTGNYLRNDDIEKLINICLINNLPLIIDEVFFDYNFDFNPELTINLFQEHNIPIFILNGLSKLVAMPQMKLGWIYFTSDIFVADKLREKLEFICDTYLSVNTPIINATPEILKSGKIIQQQIKERISKNLNHLLNIEKNIGKFKILNYEGGWYAILKSKKNIDDDKLAFELLKEKNIFIYPGYFYDFSKSGFIVVSLIIPEVNFKKGIEGILQILN